jgi:4a-hydroxytetrahydrobiopterin dehydratase
MSTHGKSNRTALQDEHCTADAKALDPAGIVALMPALAGWASDHARLRKRFAFDDFHHTIAFVNAIAWVAHREDHHPDLEVGYDHCTVTWSTHSAGGITRNDFVCAARTESLFDA